MVGLRLSLNPGFKELRLELNHLNLGLGINVCLCSGKGLCNLENNKTLEFFRVNNMDAIYFPRDTFSTLRIHSGIFRIHSVNSGYIQVYLGYIQYTQDTFMYI